MTIAILHLSDIHFANPADAVTRRVENISTAIVPNLRDATSLVVLVSGDIAQAGLSEEYSIAEEFLSALIVGIGKQSAVSISVVLAPGNHDCDFSGDQDVRHAIIDVVKKKGGAIPEGYISTGVKVQENFFSFRERIETGTSARLNDPLWKSHLLEVEGKRIIFDMLNASWMSTKHEQQGGLVFPFEQFSNQKPSDADLRIVTMHHPLNWYNQNNYLKFRGFIHHLADLVVTGHEHQSSGRTADDAVDGECAYIEGAALQMRDDPLSSGFNFIEIDLTTDRFKYTPYCLKEGHYSPSSTSMEWRHYRALPKRQASDLSITESFRATLLDPGATLKHPSGIALTLEDIYVFPDLDSRIDKRSDKVRGKPISKPSSKHLTDLPSLKKNVLVGGTEVAGKTCLLYRLFDIYHSHGFFPLFLRGKDLKRSGSSDIEKYLANAIDVQYGSHVGERFRQLEKDKKVLLIDDLDQSPIKGAPKRALLDALTFGFHRVVATVSDSFEIAEMFETEDGTSFSDFEQYQISPLGYERRGDLIRKWIGVGHDETKSTNDVLKIFDDAENLIENARLQHIASTVPIYVLSLLQASASGLSKEMHNSSFAHYYYFLIVGALEKGGIKADQMGPYIAACTHLSWFIKVNGDDHRISTAEFERFVATYSKEWTETDPAKLLEVLIASRLIDSDGGAIYFTYPYSYYYFLGRFASISIGQEQVDAYLEHCVRNLYVRECANTLLFLAHHTGNDAVLELVVNALKEHFPQTTPMTLAKEDAKAVTAMMAMAPALSYKTRKPAEYRKDIAKHRDQNENHDGLIEKPLPKRSLFHDLISLIKSIEIAGALLTHQFSNYQRTKKVDAIKQVFESSLRAIREIYYLFEKDHEQLVASLALRAKQNSDLTAEQAETQMRLAIGMLMRLIAAGLLNKAGLHLTSRDLVGHVDEVIGINPNQAYRLIKIAQLLQHPGRLPRLEIDRIVRDEADNPCVMGPLQLLVLQRMYMYETDYDDKDWAASVFLLGGSSKSLELRHRKGPHKLNWRTD
jgi:hypothetical protein